MEKETHHPRQLVYVGIAAEPGRIAISFYDGHWSVGNLLLQTNTSTTQTLLASISEFARTRNVLPVAAGIDIARLSVSNYLMFHNDGNSRLSDDSFDRLPQRLWFDYDILPFRVAVCGLMLEECADSAARKCLQWFRTCCVPKLDFAPSNRVMVDCDSIELAALSDYQSTVSAETWKVLLKLTEACKQRRLRISFFNSTPQGGGVALMRHSLIRLFRLLHIDARWFVPKPNPTVFRITKDIHNLLQGVAGPEVDFTQAQQKTYEQWLESNCEHLNWTSDVFTNSDVIILDDPQLLGCVKHIRKSWHGRGKQIVIYRSHIQIRTDLIKDPSKPQYRLWNYLMSHIRQCDLFISHPLSLQSVPSDIPTSKVVFMPAFADPLDGLNKSMPTDQVFHYLSQFNHHCLLQTGNTQGLQYPHRQFIVQLSRFDPSKGQLDALECFRMLRERLDSTVPLSRLPQLVLAGHGSVDDPDGTVVFQQLMERLSDERFDRVRQDVLIARLPPEDRILNALLRCARVALQLSCQEGFEVKVTEALHKAVPVVAYRAGGIALQIKHGQSGYLCEIGDMKAVVDHLSELLSNERLWSEMSQCACLSVTEDYWTVNGAVNWLWLFNDFIQKDVHAPEGSEYVSIDSGFRWAQQEWKSFGKK